MSFKNKLLRLAEVGGIENDLTPEDIAKLDDESKLDLNKVDLSKLDSLIAEAEKAGGFPHKETSSNKSNPLQEYVESPDSRGILQTIGRNVGDYLQEKDKASVKAMSGGYLPIDKMIPTRVDSFDGQRTKGSKLGEFIGNLQGSAGLGAMTGMGAARLLPALGEIPGISGALSRILVNAGLGGAQEGLRKPNTGETRTDNAVTGAAFGGGLSSIAEVLNGGRGAYKTLGRYLGKLTPEEADIIANKPQEAEKLATSYRDNGDQLNEELQNMFRGNRVAGGREGGIIGDRIQEYIDPIQAKKASTLIGKLIRVKSDSMAKTSPEVEAEFQRMINAQKGFPTEKKIPYEIQHNSNTQTPSDSTQLGFGIESPVEVDPHTLESTNPDPNISIFNRKGSGKLGYSKAKKFEDFTENSIKDGFNESQDGLPLKSLVHDVEYVDPESGKYVTLTGTQADKLKKMAFDAAEARKMAAQTAPNPVAYTAKNDPDWNAALDLRSGIENVAPASIPYNEPVEQALNYKDKAQRLGGNLKAIINPNESEGSTNKDMRNFLDRITGSNLNEMQKMNSAGTKVLPSKYLEPANVKKALASGLIGNSTMSKNDGMANLQAILGIKDSASDVLSQYLKSRQDQ